MMNETTTMTTKAALEANKALKIFELYSSLYERFKADATFSDRKAFNDFLESIQEDFPTMKASCFNMTVEDIVALDETSIRAKLTELEEKESEKEKYAAYAKATTTMYINLQAYYSIVTAFLSEWSIRNNSPLTMFKG